MLLWAIFMSYFSKIRSESGLPIMGAPPPPPTPPKKNKKKEEDENKR
jgi:hypothetical protein